ncbi:ribosome small subunit-dependent GTPase A [soil metagenome]
MSLAYRSLAELGWDDRFESDFSPHRARDLEPGRVIRSIRATYSLTTERGPVTGRVSGAFRRDAGEVDLPAVGDWVALEAEGQDAAAIRAILPRRSYIRRKVAGERTREQVIAANLDFVFIVSSLNSELRPRRIERYLTSAYDSGATPVVVLTKADLHYDPEQAVAEVAAIAPGTPVHAVNCLTEEGASLLRGYFDDNRTVALIGSSGVGKSTLVNTLAGSTVLVTRDIREDDKGRHTTTHRELVSLPRGGHVIDTPGMRELQLWDGSVEEAFADVEELAASCRFSDCRHDREPGCAVQAAVEAGTLAPSRLESYRKLERELRFVRAKQNARSRAEERKRDKHIGKANRQRMKLEQTRDRNR